MEPQQYVEWPGSACYCQRSPACQPVGHGKYPSCAVFLECSLTEWRKPSEQWTLCIRIDCRGLYFQTQTLVHLASLLLTEWDHLPASPSSPPYHTTPHPPRLNLTCHWCPINSAIVWWCPTSSLLTYGSKDPGFWLFSDLFCFDPKSSLFPRTRTFLKQWLLVGAQECLLSWAVGMISW